MQSFPTLQNSFKVKIAQERSSRQLSVDVLQVPVINKTIKWKPASKETLVKFKIVVFFFMILQFFAFFKKGKILWVL